MKKNKLASPLLLSSSLLLSGNVLAFTDLIDFNSLGGTYIPGEVLHEMSKFGGHTLFLNDKPGLINGFFIGPYGSPGFNPYEGPIDKNVMEVENILPIRGDSDPFSYNGTDYAIFAPGLKITRSDGGTFSVNSIDLAVWRDYFPTTKDAGPITETTITATFGDGSVRTQLISFPNLISHADNQSGNDFSTFTLTGFIDIVDFKIYNPLLSITTLDSIAIDNISISYDTPIIIPDIPSPAPEPSTYAMLLAGLGLIGFMGRKRA